MLMNTTGFPSTWRPAMTLKSPIISIRGTIITMGQASSITCTGTPTVITTTTAMIMNMITATSKRW